MKTEEYTECSNCNMDGPVRSMQDELPLDNPLCRKCRNAIPATVEDLINRYDAYITDLGISHSNYKLMANRAVESLVEVAEVHVLEDCLEIAEGMSRLLDTENKLSKTLHRP